MLVTKIDAVEVPGNVALRKILIVEGGGMERLMDVADEMNHPAQGQRSLSQRDRVVGEFLALVGKLDEKISLGRHGLRVATYRAVFVVPRATMKGVERVFAVTDKIGPDSSLFQGTHVGVRMMAEQLGHPGPGGGLHILKSDLGDGFMTGVPPGPDGLAEQKKKEQESHSQAILAPYVYGLSCGCETKFMLAAAGLDTVHFAIGHVGGVRTPGEIATFDFHSRHGSVAWTDYLEMSCFLRIDKNGSCAAFGGAVSTFRHVRAGVAHVVFFARDFSFHTIPGTGYLQLLKIVHTDPPFSLQGILRLEREK